MRLASKRFLVWYRALPVAFLLVFGLISSVYTYAPALVFKPFYPIKYESYIKASSVRHGLDPYLVCAVIKAESNWEPTAQSNQGAQGLMQLLPETAQDMIAQGEVNGSSYSSQNLSDPETNIEFGCAYLSYLLKYFNGSTDRAIAAYNAGLGNVDGWAQENTALHNAITFPETQAYLIRVNNAWSRYKTLYSDRFA